ncbi:hypothetical protein Avbf_06832 [Armadillidium vulgare]|nr:hypothetical protein Avbf_06832 [Armadillidium vulgare]
MESEPMSLFISIDKRQVPTSMGYPYGLSIICTLRLQSMINLTRSYIKLQHYLASHTCFTRANGILEQLKSNSRCYFRLKKKKKMNIKFLYLSTERFYSLLYKELGLGIASVKQNISSSNHDFISVSSISLCKSEEGKDSVDEYFTIEKNYDLTKELPSVENEESFTLDDPNLQDYYKVSESLHKFADLNCENGNTVLHIFWCVQDFLPCPSETVEFYGALKRLHCWYNATLNIITNNFDAVEDWISYLPLQVIGSSVEIIRNISQNLWKGCLAFSVEGKTNVTPVSQVTLCSESKNFNIFNFCGANKGRKLFVLPVAEVFLEIQLKSIPWAFVQRESLCYLSPSSDSLPKDKEHAEKILDSLTHSDEVGVLFRLRYSYVPPLVQGVKSLDTEHWKQTIAEGNFDLQPSLSFHNRHETMVFLMLSKDTKLGLMNCVALVDPNSYGEDIVKMILQDQLQDKTLETESYHKIRNLLQGIMNILGLRFMHCLIRKQILAKKGEVADDLTEEEKLKLECCSSHQILNEFVVPSKRAKIRPSDTIIPSEVTLLVEALPEYKALEEKEKKSKCGFARVTSGDFLCGLPPPVITVKTKGIDAAHIHSCYTDYKKKIEQNQEISKECNGKWIKDVGWRDALHLKYHGIYTK